MRTRSCHLSKFRIQSERFLEEQAAVQQLQTESAIACGRLEVIRSKNKYIHLSKIINV